MRFRELRRVLQTIVLAGVPACMPDVPGVGACSEDVSKSFDVDLPADPPLTLRIESCRVDVDACMALCREVMSRAELPSPGACNVTFHSDTVEVETMYTKSLDGANCPVEGRRPAGLVEPRGIDCYDVAGHWLAQAAWLEAASVPAFIYLARELDMRRAPRGLVRAALAAVRDEIRHARIMRSLALRFGATPPAVEVAPPAERSLEALAIENAVEGCVRETWGAVLALWQAQHARDLQLRTVFAAIADDETRHAALGRAIDRWVSTQLSAPAIARVEAARAAAIRELLDAEMPPAIAILGVPGGREARGLLERTRHAVWNGGVS